MQVESKEELRRARKMLPGVNVDSWSTPPTRPLGKASRPEGKAFCPVGRTSCPAGKASRPLGKVSCSKEDLRRARKMLPGVNVDSWSPPHTRPLGKASRPVGKAFCPVGRISCPAGKASRPLGKVSCSKEDLRRARKMLPGVNVDSWSSPTPYRGTSLIRKLPPLGPYRSPMPRALRWSYGGGAVSYERGTPVHPTPYTITPKPTPYTLHPTPYTLYPNPTP